MNKIKFIGTILSLLMCASLFAATTVRFATEATYPPFEFVDASGKIQGFDIDIANALCNQMKAQCTFSNQAFNSLIPSLKLGKFDAVIASMGVTEERQKQVNFTAAYYQPSAVFVAPLANNYQAKPYQISSIADKKVGAQSGSTMEKYLHDVYGNKIDLKTYGSIQDAFLDLVSGRIDIVFADAPIASAWLQQNDNSKTYGVIDGPVVSANYFGTGYGIAVSKDNPQLLAGLNQALKTIKANGTYKKIVNKYFGNE